MSKYVVLPEPPELEYGSVKVYLMTKEGKKLPPDVHPDDMISGVHYRFKILSVETLREMAARREEERRREKAEKAEMNRHNRNGYKPSRKQESG